MVAMRSLELNTAYELVDNKIHVITLYNNTHAACDELFSHLEFINLNVLKSNSAHLLIDQSRCGAFPVAMIMPRAINIWKNIDFEGTAQVAIVYQEVSILNLAMSVMQNPHYFTPKMKFFHGYKQEEALEWLKKG
jgi:hypothetical protein